MRQTIFMMRTCQCEHPMIKCDATGCRCTICGELERSSAASEFDALRWRQLPAHLEEFQIDYVGLKRAIDADLADPQTVAALRDEPQTVPLTPGKSEMLQLSKRIETGLKVDEDGFFAPPLSRKEWWMIASSLDYAARFDMPNEPQEPPVSEFERDGIARLLFDKAMCGHAQWDEMTEPNKEDWRVKADELTATAPVETSERDRCIAICEGWMERFEGMEIQYTSAREYACDAINDIIDLIRDGKWPGEEPPKSTDR